MCLLLQTKSKGTKGFREKKAGKGTDKGMGAAHQKNLKQSEEREKSDIKSSGKEINVRGRTERNGCNLSMKQGWEKMMQDLNMELQKKLGL